MRNGKRTLLANSDASVGSNAFLSTLMNDLSALSLFLGVSVFAGRLSFDLAIVTVGDVGDSKQKVLVETLTWATLGRDRHRLAECGR
jgi:hypothetical protein